MKPLVLTIPIFLLAASSAGCKKTEPAADDAAADAAPVVDAAPEAAPADAAPEAAAPKPTTAVPVVPASLVAAGQVWSGNYVCQGTGSMTLRITRAAGGSVSAVNEFKHHAGKTGSFNMSGTFNAATRQLSLVAGAFIQQAPGIASVNLDGTVTADGKTYAGRVVGAGCSSFNLHR